MRFIPMAATAALAALVAVACTADSPTTLAPDQPVFAKPGGDAGGLVSSECGGKTELRDSRATLTWSGSIGGDGSDAFTGDEAGVHAKVFYHDGGCSRSGDLVFDADMNSRKVKRHLTFHFPEQNGAGLPSGAVAAAPFVNFQGLMFLGSDIGVPEVSDSRDAKVEEKNPGAPRAAEYPSPSAERPGYPAYSEAGSRPFRFNSMGVAGCEVLEYAWISLTRNAGSYEQVQADPLLGQWSHSALGAWIVESVGEEGAHWAQCYVSVQGSLEKNGPPMNMPFSVSIAEVR